MQLELCVVCILRYDKELPRHTYHELNGRRTGANAADMSITQLDSSGNEATPPKQYIPM